jgi:hypothetical protein
MVVKMLVAVFWVLILCSVGDGYQCFGGPYHTLKIEAVLFSKTLMITSSITWYHNPEGQNWQITSSSRIQFF